MYERSGQNDSVATDCPWEPAEWPTLRRSSQKPGRSSATWTLSAWSSMEGTGRVPQLSLNILTGKPNFFWKPARKVEFKLSIKDKERRRERIQIKMSTKSLVETAQKIMKKTSWLTLWDLICVVEAMKENFQNHRSRKIILVYFLLDFSH